jgi:superfamily II RNA helicase
MKTSPCFNCEKFEDHIAQVKLKEKLELKIENNLSEIGKLHQLFGAEQFNQMVHVLQALGYVDANFLPTSKLNMARKLMAGPEILLLCEVFYANLFNVFLCSLKFSFF